MAIDSQISRRSLLAAFGLIPAAGLLRAQQQDPATFSTGVKVVNLFANVRNKKGEIVRDLTKDDFLLDEEGHPQTIAYFSQESDLPLTLGLMVDTSGSQRNLIDQERAASYRFFEQVLRPEKDVAFVIHFDFDTELLQDITSSRRLLEQALEDLSAPSQLRQRGQQGGQQGRYPGGGGGYPGGGYPGGGGQGRTRGGGTVLYDAVLLGSDEIMRKQKGRKALVILSDGVDTGSKVSLSSAVEAAQRADTLVYSVLFEDRDAYGSPGFGGMGRGGRGRGRMPMPTSAPANGKKVLERISTETGGRFFEVSKKEPLEKIYQEIEEDLRHQYSLGYTPSEHAAGYRKIHLATKQKGLTVQTRDGYYAT